MGDGRDIRCGASAVNYMFYVFWNREVGRSWHVRWRLDGGIGPENSSVVSDATRIEMQLCACVNAQPTFSHAWLQDPCRRQLTLPPVRAALSKPSVRRRPQRPRQRPMRMVPRSADPEEIDIERFAILVFWWRRAKWMWIRGRVLRKRWAS